MRPEFLPVLLGFTALVPAAGPVGMDPASDPPVEPPERIVVTVGTERLVLDSGRAGKLSDGTPVLAELSPTRVFDIGAPFTFDFPREWRLRGTGGMPGAWWSVRGLGASLEVRSLTGDPEQAVAKYVRSAQGGTGRDIEPIEKLLHGVVVRGERCRASGLSSRGMDEGDWIIECFSVPDADGAHRLVAFHRQLSLRPPTLDFTIHDITSVAAPADEWSDDVQEPVFAAIAASWRWDH